jgi:hypothetical protein
MPVESEASALAGLAGRGIAGDVRRAEETHQATAARSLRAPGERNERSAIAR